MIGNKGTVALLSVHDEKVLVGLTNGCIRFHSVRAGADLEFPIGGVVR